MPLQTLSCLCIPYIKSCSSKGLSGQSTILWLLFSLTSTVKGVCGLIHVLKTFHRLYHAKYIWVHGSNSVRFFLLLKYHFLHYIGKGRGVAKWDPAQVNPRLKLHVHTKF